MASNIEPIQASPSRGSWYAPNTRAPRGPSDDNARLHKAHAPRTPGDWVALGELAPPVARYARARRRGVN
jgi:hypothetical protein